MRETIRAFTWPDKQLLSDETRVTSPWGTTSKTPNAAQLRYVGPQMGLAWVGLLPSDFVVPHMNPWGPCLEMGWGLPQGGVPNRHTGKFRVKEHEWYMRSECDVGVQSKSGRRQSLSCCTEGAGRSRSTVRTEGSSTKENSNMFVKPTNISKFTHFPSR